MVTEDDEDVLIQADRQAGLWGQEVIIMSASPKHLRNHLRADADGTDYRIPADALATAQFALQQWSLLTEGRDGRLELRTDPEVPEEEVKLRHDEADGEAAGTRTGTETGAGAVDHSNSKTERGSYLVCTVMSLQYAKLIMVLGLVLPITEVLAHENAFRFHRVYQVFYLYLYLTSILFMMFTYISSKWKNRTKLIVRREKGARGTRYRLKRLKQEREKETVRYGSIYLRLGANAFGIGSVVYNGLEIARALERHFFGQGECEAGEEILLPACRALLTLLQMHFMLFNDKVSQIRNYASFARFGLAHMIATNVCEWLSIVVEETRHEIAELGTGGWILADRDDLDGLTGKNASDGNGTTMVNCTREGPDIIGNLLQSSGPFLFPCFIEYSLICAVILFEMWKHVKLCDHEDGSNSSIRTGDVAGEPSEGGSVINKRPLSTVTTASSGPSRNAHVLSVDLTHSQKGMFLGIIFVVSTILSLVLFVAIGETTHLQRTAHTLIAYLEIALHSVLVLAVIVAAVRMRNLSVDNVPYYPLPLDLFLLLVAQAGAYLYSIFSLVGACMILVQQEEAGHTHNSAIRCVVVEATALVHACIQTHLILRAWHVRCVGEREWSAKPGRQHITFLMVGNICLWLVATFCKARAQFRPLHLQLFGVWPWTVLTHIAMPLTIFLHFHSSICLFEIWKNCYKYRSD